MDISCYRSDIQEKIKKIQTLIKKAPGDALEECNAILEYGENQRDDAIIGFAHFSKGRIYYLTNEIALFYLEMSKCSLHLKRIREWGFMAISHNLQGKIAYHRGNIALALDQYSKALEYTKQNKIFDVECLTELNIAELYLAMGYIDEAIEKLDFCYKYVSNHMEMNDYVDVLSRILLARGRIHINNESIEEAWSVKNEIEQKCLTFMSESGKMNFNCFVATLANIAGAQDVRDEFLTKVKDTYKEDLPIIDIYDNLYVFLSMLVEINDVDTFNGFFDKIIGPVRNTYVKNIEKEIFELKLKLLKKNDKNDEYNQTAGEFADLIATMETENSLALGSIIGIKNELQKKVEELAQKEKDLSKANLLARTDPMTGIPNRLQLCEHAQTAFERSVKNKVGFAIEFFDIDFFKEFVEEFGHVEGEKCLAKIAEIVKKLLKKHSGAECYHYNGDQFVVIYQSYAEAEVFEMAKSIKNVILKENIQNPNAKGDEKVITVSQGLCWGVPTEKMQIGEYFFGADDHLCKVKQKSRNSIMLGKIKSSEKDEEKKIIMPLITLPEEEITLPREN